MKILSAHLFLSLLLFSNFIPEKTNAVESAFQSSLLDSTVRIRYERHEGNNLITGHGTAFGVDINRFGYQGKRYLLTAAHNVLDTKDQPFATLSIEINDGKHLCWSPCKVVAFDKQMDVCLVESAEDLRSVMELDTVEAGPGIPIVLAGSPRGIPVTLYYGDVIRCFEGGSVRSSAKIEFDHGDSGGPVVNAKTQKISGVAVAGFPKDGDLDHTRGMFVPLMAVNSFLQSNQRGNSIASLPVVDIATIQASSERKSVSAPIVINTDDVETVLLVSPKPVVSLPPAVRSAPVAVVTPVVASAPALVSIPLVKTGYSPSHIVVSGESLTLIARKYGTTLQELQRLNEIKNPDLITVGTRLTLPSHP